MTNYHHNWINKIPKLDLHRHLTGCITQEMLNSLIMKNHFDKFSEKNSGDFFNFSNSDQFFHTHRKVRSIIQDLDDFTYLANNIVNQLEFDNIIYTELLFSPQIFISYGFSLSEMLTTLFKVFKTSISKINLIIEFSRSRGRSSAEEVFDDLLLLLDADYGRMIKGISLGGDEVNYSAKPFMTIFDKARKNGLQVIAHAGEWVGPHSVWEVIKDLNVQRIIHGITSIQDKGLIGYLIKNNIPLDISISSNYATGAVNKREIHPIVNLNQLGLKILLSTDMPGYFNVTMSSEFKKLLMVNFSGEDIIKIIKNTIFASLAKSEEKSDLYQQLDQFITKNIDLN